MTAVSVVIAVYNVQAYLPRFVQALQSQSLQDFEALFIDDASSDQSAALLEGFASADPRLKLIRHTNNLGCGAACNTGIRAAQGETICFADPDDLLPENSLEVRHVAYKKHQAIVRACHAEMTDEGKLLHHETRPAKLPEICAPVEVAPQFGVNPFLCAHWTWLLPTNLLRRHNIFHDENMRTGDDIAMLAQLFFHISRLVWLPDTVYYWIKRADSLSTTVYTPQHYANYFQCCDIFYEEAAKRGQTRLADMFCDTYLNCYLAHLLQQAATGKSSEAEAREVLGQMASVCEQRDVFPRCLPGMDKNPLRYPGLYRLRHILRNGSGSAVQRLLESHKAVAELAQEAEYALIRKNGWSNTVTYDKFDAEQGLLRARYLFCDTPPEESLRCGDTQLAPAFAKNRRVFDGNDYTIFERILWLPVPEKGQDKLTLRVAGQNTGLEHTPQTVREAFTPKPLDDKNFPPEVRALRRLAQSPAIREQFQDAWMFMDRDTQADDNAEHLYRYILRHHPEINAWFVLREESQDWSRLKAEGFRLIPFDSPEHDALFLLAKNLISSQMDTYIYARLEKRYYSDIRRCKFTCLQHGVIKEDLSPWLNSIDMDCFITTTEAEYRSIVANGTNYALTSKEVVRTGLARHDTLLTPSTPEKRIFVMPSWRADLAGNWDSKGQRRDYNPNFSASAFASTWRQLLASPKLAELCEKYGYETVFWPHPGFSDYLEEFNLPPHIRTPAGESLQTLLKSSALLITDYSSIAFDMAFLQRSILYYQFDSLASFAAGQNRRTGYFSYEHDGFGPICHTEGELLEHMYEILRTGCRPAIEYLERIINTMSLKDGKCCARTVKAILNLHIHRGEERHG